MAVRLGASIIINRPIEVVFLSLDNIERMADITPVPMEITAVERLPNGGKRVRFRTRGRGGKWCDAVSEQVEYLPYLRVVVHSKTVGVTTIACRDFEPLEGGTRLTATVTYRVNVPLLGALIEFQWRRRSRQVLVQFLARIKTELEEGLTP